MSIRLLQSIFIAGVLSPVDGSTLSLSAALEADLVNQGKAVWVAAPELTASELAHASAHARMRPPNGVPIILAQSAIPMILPSSGTMGANGSLTGLTALPYSVFPQPCFMYFPAGKVFSGSPAGMYYAILTSATAATVYNNMYTSGLPQDAIYASPTAVVDAGPGAYTQTTGADIALININTTGGMIGRNGCLAARRYVSMGQAAGGTRSGKLTLGGTMIAAESSMTNTYLAGGISKYLFNRGTQNSNVCPLYGNWPGADALVTQVNSNLFTSIDTSVDKTLSMLAQLVTTATDYYIIDAFRVEVLPG